MSPASMKSAAAVWPAPSLPRLSCSTPNATFPASATRRWCRPPNANGYDDIIRHAVAWAVAAADPREIDTINIHQASLRAMQRAVMSLAPLPDIVLVDAFRVPDLPMAQRGVVHGDRRCAAIAAASILAKVTRDRDMVALHDRDPRYGFDRHKGYATAEHLDAVARFGYSDAHRRSFRPPTLFDTIE
jgi:ribonuclease HII